MPFFLFSISFFNKNNLLRSCGTALLVHLICFNAAQAGTLQKPNGSPPPTEVEKIPIPLPIRIPPNTEMGVTVSQIQPFGLAHFLGEQTYNLNKVRPATSLTGQIQHWTLFDTERDQRLGVLFSTSLADKKVTLDLANGNTLTKVNLMYFNFLFGLNWEKTFFDDRLSLGLVGFLSEDLWQANDISLSTQWAQWTPALGSGLQVKGWLNQRWYCLGHLNNSWYLSDSKNESATQQRLHVGVGFSL